MTDRALATTELDRITRRAKLVAVSKLSPHPDNPRTITPERMAQLKQNLERDPGMLEARPLIALPDGRVIGGNQRLIAARELGWKRLPVIVVDLDEATAREWMLRDNNGFGEWDDGALALMLAGLDSDGVDLALTGFDEGRIEELLAGLVPPSEADPDEVPPLPRHAVTTPGEVFDLGPHRLICGDATDPATLARLLGDERPDIVWTDPPYGVDVQGRTAEKLRIQNDNLLVGDLQALLASAFAAAAAVCRKGAAWYVAAPMGPQMAAFTGPLLELGIWRQTIIWVKDSFVLARADYHYRHEAVLYGAVAGEATLAPPDLAYAEDGSDALIYGWEPSASHIRPPTRKQDTIWAVPRPKASADHPTTKPVALIERALQNSSRRGDIVLDVFAGSGSTLIAAERLGRVARLVEIDPVYCDVIRDRYEAFVG